MMGTLKGIGWLGLLLLQVGCATTYQVPDYYDTKRVPYHFKVGEIRPIDELRASKSQEEPVRASQRSKNAWIKHRDYKKQYYFE